MIFGVIGWPLGHSLTPLVYNEAFRSLGLGHTMVALPCKDGRAALAAGQALGFRGFAVTIPHKLAAAQAAIRLDAVSGRLGAVNTMLFTARGSVGSNTDVPALRAALRRLGPRLRGPAVILGSGGVARAGALALARERLTPISVVARRPAQGRKILKALGAASRGTVRAWNKRNLLRSISEASVLLQATPVGMSPRSKASPVPREALRPDLAVCETVYNPRRTLLIRQAQQKSCRTVGGEVVFLEQAIRQFRILTGRRAPRAVMARALDKALRA